MSIWLFWSTAAVLAMGTVWYLVAPSARRGSPALASGLLVGFPLLAVLFYLALGAPICRMRRLPRVWRAGGKSATGCGAARLEAELRARPNDAQGWRLLARLRQGVGDHAKAADAWQRLIALGEDDTQVDTEALTGLAVALIEQDGGVVSSAAFELLERVLRSRPKIYRPVSGMQLLCANKGQRGSACRIYRIARGPPRRPAISCDA